MLIISLYPELPLSESYLVILSQSITTNLGKFLIIIFTKVDFPVAIPPVNPNSLIIFSFRPMRYIKIQGNKVVKNGFI